jgi:hypothetical protein
LARVVATHVHCWAHRRHTHRSMPTQHTHRYHWPHHAPPTPFGTHVALPTTPSCIPSGTCFFALQCTHHTYRRCLTPTHFAARPTPFHCVPQAYMAVLCRYPASHHTPWQRCCCSPHACHTMLPMIGTSIAASRKTFRASPEFRAPSWHCGPNCAPDPAPPVRTRALRLLVVPPGTNNTAVHHATRQSPTSQP